MPSRLGVDLKKLISLELIHFKWRAEPTVKTVRIDIDPTEMPRIPADVKIIADATTGTDALINELEKTVGSKAKKRKAPTYSADFHGFWNSYQKIPKRASGQSKPKAWAEWQKLPEATQQALEAALKAALKEQAAIELKGGFAAAFPDCFRWLRDGRYEAHLPSDTSQIVYSPVLRDPAATSDDPF